MAKKCKPGEHDYEYRYDDGNYQIWICLICGDVDKRRVRW